MISPTKRQMDVLRFVTGWQEANGGVSPPLSDICSALGFASRSGAFKALAALKERGLIRRGFGVNTVPPIEVLHPPAIPRDPQGQPLYFVEVGK